MFGLKIDGVTVCQTDRKYGNVKLSLINTAQLSYISIFAFYYTEFRIEIQ